MKNQSLKSIVNGAEMKSAVKELEENIEMFIEVLKVKKFHFDAAIKAGFTEQQALVLTDLMFKLSGDNNAK